MNFKINITQIGIKVDSVLWQNIEFFSKNKLLLMHNLYKLHKKYLSVDDI